MTKRTITILAISILILSRAAAGLPCWEFESETDANAWVANAHLANVEVKNGTLRADAIDGDPVFHCRGIDIKATPWQYVLVRIKATRPGAGDVYWSGKLEGKYGGLTEKKKIRFKVRGNGQWDEIAIFPFWHTEGTVRQLRLDVYDNSHFEIDYIRILEWGGGRLPQSGCFMWSFGGNTTGWQIHPDAPELFAPPLDLDVSEKNWVTVQLKSSEENIAGILWACERKGGLQTKDFAIKGDGKLHSYNIQMADVDGWSDRIIAFGIRLPGQGDVHLESIRIGEEPFGPVELEVNYFGFENGVNRAGRPCRVLAQMVNRGGKRGGIRSIGLSLPKGLRLLKEPTNTPVENLEYDQQANFIWEIAAEKTGKYEVTLHFAGKGAPPDQKTFLHFTKPLDVPRASYVPEPQPVKTDMDVCAYYFPGWGKDEKWDCVRKTAPVRKPVLGYYDESNPECVDWQIKWAAENGIDCFLVDWYWVAGKQYLTHWFDAYRKAKYRDYLKVAIMWANHNPPNTHSVEDWLNVTKHWLDNYFGLKTYYRIDGKPAVFIWNPKGIRKDLGGSDVVKKTFDKSQEMARAAGYDGITLIAIGYDFSSSNVKALIEEGYTGITTYHEWGKSVVATVSQKRFRFEDVVRDSPAAWQEKDKSSGALTYYPVVDTGWDSRPWHGCSAMAIEGRTPELFEQLLRKAKTFCRNNDKPFVVLGPVNEWGEGSYIEPCTEYDFEMLEAVRRVFAEGAAATWPVNVAPSDVGLGHYNFVKENQQ